MQILVWWVLPALTTVLAVCWAAWVRRAPRVPRDVDTVDAYAQFRAALSAPSTERANRRDDIADRTAPRLPT